MEPATLGSPSPNAGGASLEEISRLHLDCAMATNTEEIWGAVLDSARRLAGAPYGFIAEVSATPSGDPVSSVVATRWVSDGRDQVALHPDTEAAVRAVLRSGSAISMPGSDNPIRDSSMLSPMSRLLVVPMVSGRFVGLVGLTGDQALRDPALPDLLHPLLASGAAIIESRSLGEPHVDHLMAASLVETTPDLVAWAGGDRRLQYLNEGGRRLTGITDNASIASVELESLIAQPYRPAFLAEVLPAAETLGVWVGESAIRGESGDPIPVSLVVLAEAPSESAPFIAILAHDLSERHEVDRLKDAFVSNVSHELRTPLTSMIGFLEMLADESVGPLTAQQRTLVSGIERNTETLRMLIGEILEVVNDWDAANRVLEEFNLSAVAAFELNRIAFDARNRGMVIDTDFEKGCTLVADKTAVQRAAAHLVQNAVKFGRIGGKISVKTRSNGDVTLLEVSDDGIGIDPSEVGKVFDRFYRAENAQRLEIRGTGLGLSYVKRVADLHGGDVDIISQIGEGTTVTLSLPKAR